tara:strand:+ start:754 stop:1542 length:789 start_codon:yes stop_codon:yes gene_type:complete
LHENISCEKFREPNVAAQKPTKNDHESENTKRTAAGFISLSTTGTPTEIHKIDRLQTRLRRMKYGTLTGARLHEEDLQQTKSRYRRAMVTLTYRNVDDWRADDVSYFMRLVRQWCKRRKISVRYVWVAELQKRGAVHYHVVFWLPIGVTLPKPDKHGWWPHGMTRIEWVKRPVAYLAKYLSKDDADAFPKGCRIMGCGGLSDGARNERCWWLMPTWVKDIATIDDKPRRATGGGIVLKSSGEIVPSPWKVHITNLGIFVIKR